MTTNEVLMATIVPKDELNTTTSGCQVCMKRLDGEDGGDTNLKYNLCTEHLVKVVGGGGEEGSGPLAMLLARGVIMVCTYSRIDAYKIRVEVRSSRRSELLDCMKAFGIGRVYAHSTRVYRWSCASLKDLHRMGSILMPFLPEFGILLQTYIVQPNKKVRSAFAEAFMQKMGTRTVHLLRYL